MEKVNLAQKFGLIQEYWHPRIVGEVNESYVKLVKLTGEFVWHKHDNEDELFLVVKGNLLIKLRDKDIRLSEGELVIIPKGVEHMPVAEEEVQGHAVDQAELIDGLEVGVLGAEVKLMAFPVLVGRTFVGGARVD